MFACSPMSKSQTHRNKFGLQDAMRGVFAPRGNHEP